jgi:hypothetical protein
MTSTKAVRRGAYLRWRERLGERENVAVYLDQATCASSGPPALPNCAKEFWEACKI